MEPEIRTLVDISGSRAALKGRADMVLERARWIPFERLRGSLRARVRIRAHHAGADATVTDLGEGRAEVRFDEPQRAVTPGQAAVAYDGDLVLGGGWIHG